MNGDELRPRPQADAEAIVVPRIVPDLTPRYEPIFLDQSVTVAAAAGLMCERDAGAVLIVDADGGLRGIFTERDVSFRVVAAGQDPKRTALGRVMTKDPDTVRAGDSVLLALEHMHERHYRHLPIVDGDELVGVVALRDILAVASRQIGGELARLSGEVPQCRIASDVMPQNAPVTLPPEASVRKAARQMCERSTSAVLVCEGSALKGIFTERDVSFRVVSRDLDPDETLLGDVMTADPTTIRLDDVCGAVIQTMLAGQFRHLPVTDGERLLGVVSLRNLYACIKLTFETGFEDAMRARARQMPEI